MAVPAKWYTKGKKSLANKEADWDTDAIMIALFTTTLVPSQDNDQYFDAAPYTTNQLANGLGYTTGGKQLTAVTATASTLKFVMSSAALTWNFSGSVTFRYGII